MSHLIFWLIIINFIKIVNTQGRTIICEVRKLPLKGVCNVCSNVLCICNQHKWCDNGVDHNCCCPEAYPLQENCYEIGKCAYYCCPIPATPCGDQHLQCCGMPTTPTTSSIPSTTTTSTSTSQTTSESSWQTIFPAEIITRQNSSSTTEHTTIFPENPSKISNNLKICLSIAIPSTAITIIVYLALRKLRLLQRRNSISSTENTTLLNQHASQDECDGPIITEVIVPSVEPNNVEYKEKIGKGTFGSVYKAEINNNAYAVKKIQIGVFSGSKKEDVTKEIKFMLELKSEYVVEIFDFWEENNSNRTGSYSYICIRMEYCKVNLESVVISLSQMPEEDDKLIKWLIASELFKELVECVNYLHTFKSGPVIHRDIKPSNILIAQNDNGRFLKLCDFGLSKYIDKSRHTVNTGTAKYMAPEIMSGRYNIKADIYSLAIVAMELFGIDYDVKLETPCNLNKCLKQYDSNEMKAPRKYLLDILSSMITVEYNERPSCDDLLSYFHRITLKKEILRANDSSNFNNNCGENFLKNILNVKLNQLNA